MMWLKTRPAQAVRRLKDLAKIDVKTSTPLGTDDVVIAVHISEKTKTQIKTQDYAIKRSTLDRIATFCETANVALDQLGPQNSSVDFLAELSVGKSRSIFEFQKWTAICCLSAALILGGLWVRQSKTLNQLNLRASSLQADALSARQTTGQLETRYTQLAWMIDRRKNYSSVVEAWEKLSLALPEQAWLSELQQTGNDLEVIGFAKQAAPLVNLLENDPAFEAVRLAAPISLDNRSGTERFSLALRVVPGAVSDSQELSE